jgi:glycosyltransferase involved in cell wall biosynthesis
MPGLEKAGHTDNDDRLPNTTMTSTSTQETSRYDRCCQPPPPFSRRPNSRAVLSAKGCFMKTILMLLDFVPDQHRTFETFLLRLAQQLRARDWQPVFVFSGEPSEAFAARLREENAAYHVTKFPLQSQSLQALVASLNGLSPAVMTNTFVSCFDPLLLRLKKRLGIPHWIVHDESSGVASPKSGLKRVLAKLRGWYYGRHIDRVLAVSGFVAQRNIEQSFLPRPCVKVLPNGVDLDCFQPLSTPNPARPDEQVVVFVGQLVPEKGVLTLLRAMLLLKNRPVPVTPTLKLAGRGPLEAELRAFAADNCLDRVEFLGQVSDVPALFRAATVVVVPSEWAEAFGLVVAEAMACGSCVLAADVAGIPDIVGHDEEGGRLFRNGNPNDLAEKLLALLNDPAAQERFRGRARARAESLFGLDDMVRGFVKEVQEVSGNI